MHVGHFYYSEHWHIHFLLSLLIQLHIQIVLMSNYFIKVLGGIEQKGALYPMELLLDAGETTDFQAFFEFDGVLRFPVQSQKALLLQAIEAAFCQFY